MRASVGKDMMAAFKKIQAGDFGPAKNDNSKQPDHTVANLLVTMVHIGMGTTPNLELVLECPAALVPALHARLNTIPRMHDVGALTTTLNASSTVAGQTLKWICANIGVDIIPTTGDLKISLMPASVHQFIVTKHVPKLQKFFDKYMANESSHSMVLFHGTSMRALLSVLRTGLGPSSDT